MNDVQKVNNFVFMLKLNTEFQTEVINSVEKNNFMRNLSKRLFQDVKHCDGCCMHIFHS
jgi:hypothetical protein